MTKAHRAHDHPDQQGNLLYGSGQSAVGRDPSASGRARFANDNRELGKFHHRYPRPRGTPQIEVEFALDANGILNVTATDKATGKSQNITIKARPVWSARSSMKQEAEANAEADKQKRELVDLKNRADGVVHQTRKTLDARRQGLQRSPRQDRVGSVEPRRQDQRRRQVRDRSGSKGETASMEPARSSTSRKPPSRRPAAQPATPRPPMRAVRTPTTWSTRSTRSGGLIRWLGDRPL